MQSVTLSREAGESKMEKYVNEWIDDIKAIILESRDKAVKYIVDMYESGVSKIETFKFACNTQEIIDYFTNLILEKVKEFGIRDSVASIILNEVQEDDNAIVKDYKNTHGFTAL